MQQGHKAVRNPPPLGVGRFNHQEVILSRLGHGPASLRELSGELVGKGPGLPHSCTIDDVRVVARRETDELIAAGKVECLTIGLNALYRLAH